MGDSTSLATAAFPTFEFAFKSLDANYTANEHGVISMLRDADGQPVPQDLVFVIKIVENAEPKWLLEEVEIRIPTGPVSDIRNHRQDLPLGSGGASVLPATTTDEELGESNFPGCSVRERGDALTESYKGPGPTMLSNLRLVVNAEVRDDGRRGMLSVRLRPRSKGAAGSHVVGADRCTDMSFLLPRVEVSLADHELAVFPTMNIHYHGDYPVQHATQLPPPCIKLRPS
ncbi:hypothetical protein Micbo1qcDRAFT_205806 [Microdochium bolleyi]|uniref:Uncharacterized protein n=1 Tax=Microdochium bolleyi TaxID=196109 RepID=A0A136IZL1_9PEZI|nr:hypothetical protein Micbo1qcDRAFT_205806 [Microdochium bolleyi]